VLALHNRHVGSGPLTIALVASPVTPLGGDQVGGAQAVVVDLAQGLAARGHTVTVHCASGSRVPGVEVREVDVPQAAARAALVHPGRSARRVPEVDAAIASMFREVDRSGCDVVSQHAFDAAAFEIVTDPPVLHTLHLPPLEGPAVQAVREVPPWRLVTVSESSRREWAREGVRVQRVIRNGLRAEPVAEQDVRRRAFAAGRLSPEKGFEDAIRACRDAGIPLTIAGSRYDPDYRVDLDATDFIGPLPRSDVRATMARCAVFVCPIRWEEPFGLAAAEAQMSGCPVAGYRRGALPEVVEEGVSGYLAEPDDVNGLACAITRCLTLDRREVRASAQARLGIDPMLDAYESALRVLAR
ncbi:MAG: glycosyltransferase, partial [Candidatus Dormibacteraeota bacterium]|nr:glycosyltransferase [Candidatus Dormibacteraeota bacterium]